MQFPEGLALGDTKRDHPDRDTEGEPEPLFVGAAFVSDTEALNDCEGNMLSEGDMVGHAQTERLTEGEAVVEGERREEPVGGARVGDTECEGVPERDAVEVRHMVGDPEGDALAEGQCVTEMVWLALAEVEGQRVEEGVSLGDGDAVGGALCVPVTLGEAVTVSLTRGELDTEGVGVLHAEADALRLFYGDDVPLRVEEGQANPLGEPLPEGTQLTVTPPVRGREGLADALLRRVLEADVEGELHADVEAVLVGQDV